MPCFTAVPYVGLALSTSAIVCLSRPQGLLPGRSSLARSLPRVSLDPVASIDAAVP